MTGKARSEPPRESSWKRLSPEERRAQLIRIAEHLFQTRPYDEIGVIDVAKAAGITHGLIYHYFSSKEALFIASFEARAQELLDRCDADTALPLLDQLLFGIRGYLDFCEEHRVAYLNLFRSPTAAQPEFFRICEATRAALVERCLTSMGLGEGALPATRLSLRGYLGYSETIVLEWLERPTVPRAAIERLILSTIGAALRTGLELDGHPGSEAVELTMASLLAG